MARDYQTAGAHALGSGKFSIRLDGCSPKPLAAYLKALGIFRLVAEQEDALARGWWETDVFHLESGLDREGLIAFLLEEYKPTPILAPWNGKSGFYPKDNRKAIESIRDGTTQRLSTLRETIRALERFVGAKGLTTRPNPGDEKRGFLTELRSTATDEFLVWLDAAIALSPQDLMYPPLLGTGGNDGRLDFTSNFMSNLVTLIDPESGASRNEARSFLVHALFADPVTGLKDSAIGQFSPGSAGGPNAESGFEGKGMVNPWDFVLMLEGSVLLACSTARRLESRGRGVMAFPFTVRSTGSGSGSAAIADEGPARAETWMPLWSRPTGISELKYLLAEGRIVLGDRLPRDGLDAARAMTRLGVDRGIESFERFGYLQRSGLAYLATPLGRVPVLRNPDADLIDQLERHGWLNRFRRMARDSAPARLTRLVGRLESALFDSTGDASPRHLQRCLVALGECQRYMSISPAARQVCGVPVPVLSREWRTRADDGSPEYAIAVGLAGLHGLRPGPGDDKPRGGRVLSTAEYIAPVEAGGGRRRRWTDNHTNRVVWASGALDQNLARMMSRRLLDQREMKLDDLPLHGDAHLPVGLVAEWLDRPDWNRRIAKLIPGLSLVEGTRPWAMPSPARRVAPPAAFCLLKPFFVPASELEEAMPRGHPGSEPTRLPSPSEIVRMLRTDQPRRAFHWARVQLRSRGLMAPNISPAWGAGRSSRLLAGLMVPIRRADLRSLLISFFAPEVDESGTDEGPEFDHSTDRDAGEPASITLTMDD